MHEQETRRDLPGQEGTQPVTAAAPAREDSRPADSLVREQIARIAALDPEIRGVEDLLKMEERDAFRAYVRKGNDFYDAYRLACFDRLMERARASAAQQARNALGGKRHMQATAARTAGAVSVPAEEMALYRALNPGMSDGEIQHHYNKFVKERS